jgi:hypothetical protein
MDIHDRAKATYEAPIHTLYSGIRSALCISSKSAYTLQVQVYAISGADNAPEIAVYPTGCGGASEFLARYQALWAVSSPNERQGLTHHKKSPPL